MKTSMQQPGNESGKPKQKHNSVMYPRSFSLADTHLIGPDANRVLKAYGTGGRKGRETDGREERRG